jgi:hypothetical protein
MEFYTFRLDCDYNKEDILLEQLELLIKANLPKYCIFKEISSKTKKPHLQGIIGSKLKSNVSVAKIFKQVYPDRFTGTNYSIVKVKDIEQYQSYISKDGNIFINNYLSQESIDNYNANYKDIKTNYTIKDSRTFTQKVHSYFVEKHESECITLRHFYHYDYNMTESEKARQRQAKYKLIQFILNHLGDVVKVFDKNILQRIYNGILNKIILDDNKCQEKYVAHWANQLEL